MNGYIKAAEAAEILNVSRQTVINWCKKGLFEYKTGKNGHLIPVDIVNKYKKELKTMELNEAKIKDLISQQEDLIGYYNQRLRDIRAEMHLISGTAQTLAVKSYMTTIIDIMNLCDREKDVLRGIVAGDTFEEMSQMLGISRENTRILFERALRKIPTVLDIKKMEEDNAILRRDIQTYKEQFKSMIDEKNQVSMFSLTANRVDMSDDHINILHTVLNKDVGASDTLSIRTKNSLYRVGIKRVKDLARKTNFDLRQIQGLGKKCLTEIDTYLKSIGLHLGYNVDEIENEYIRRTYQDA